MVTGEFSWLSAFRRFPSYNKVKISKTIINSCLTQKRKIQYIFSTFCTFSDKEILQKPGHKPIKVFVILGDFSYQHSKKSILLFIRSSQKSPLTIRSTKITFSVKQIEIKNIYIFFVFHLSPEGRIF